jgi:Flp pilus assembly protein TadD
MNFPLSDRRSSSRFRPWLVISLAGLVLVTGCVSSPPPAQAPREATPSDLEFENGAKRAPEPGTLYVMAQLLSEQGKDDQAQSVLVRIIKEHPDYMPAYCDLSAIQMRRHQDGEAIKTLQAGLKISPHESILLNDLGMCYMVRGDHAAAAEAFTKAAGWSPDVPRYRSNLAAALGLMGRYGESLALYRQVMPAADAYHNEAVLCGARGDRAAADAFLKAAPHQEQSP